MKNYREILKTWQHKEKHANESVSVLNTLSHSSPCNFTIPGNPLNTNQENSITSVRKLKLLYLHKFMLTHLNVNSLRNKYNPLPILFRVQLIISFGPKLNLIKAALMNNSI